ncbi:DNA repair protein RecO [Candidatus Saccharibacteria bacterium]|nr:DNA repair protein RecO [Candidatus Saccharibacteria bacterium]
MANRESLRTKAIVLRRTNYGEADRILQILTPEGKMGVLARGVRREKSRLAGGIELFSVSDVVIHRGKGDLGILASVKLVEYFDALTKDLELLEMGGVMMKKVSARAEQVESAEYFELLREALRVMQRRVGQEGSWKEVVWAWWGLNLGRVSGDEVNLWFDGAGEKLLAEARYRWDDEQMALCVCEDGKVGAEHIKLLRLMQKMPLEMILRVKGVESLVRDCEEVVRCF